MLLSMLVYLKETLHYQCESAGNVSERKQWLCRRIQSHVENLIASVECTIVQNSGKETVQKTVHSCMAWPIFMLRFRVLRVPVEAPHHLVGPVSSGAPRGWKNGAVSSLLPVYPQ